MPIRYVSGEEHFIGDTNIPPKMTFYDYAARLTFSCFSNFLRLLSAIS